MWLQAITLGLQASKDRVIQEPVMQWLVSPKTDFVSPPKTVKDLQKFVIERHKELARNTITLEREIGLAIWELGCE